MDAEIHWIIKKDFKSLFWENEHIANVYLLKEISRGSSSPYFGKYPYKTRFTIFENNRLTCRPCSSTGFDQCPKGHFKCMNEVVFDFYLTD